MSDPLDDLYHDVILDHCNSPRNRRELPDADRAAEGYNPLCGDQVKVFLKLSNHHIDDACFTGVGCAICTASASMMTAAVKGKTEAEALDLFEQFHGMLIAPGSTAPMPPPGDLASLAGVHRFPMRVKCATLPWHALRAALRRETEPICTE